MLNRKQIEELLSWASPKDTVKLTKNLVKSQTDNKPNNPK